MKKVKFAYQHPTFGRSAKQKLLQPYLNSVYYYWWEFLRLNAEYRRCCERGGEGKLASLYNDFGDVYSVDFKTWWQTGDKGAYLFAEKLPPSFSVVPVEEIEAQKDVLYLRMPLSLPKRFLSQEFQKILKNHHPGSRGKRTNEQSTARYPVKGHVDIDSLAKCLRVYTMKQEFPELTLWQVGHRCGLKTSFGSDPSLLHTDDKFVLANMVSRLIKRARRMVAGVAEGKFPATT